MDHSAPAVPPIPPSVRQHTTTSRRTTSKYSTPTTESIRDRERNNAGVVTPASPEVISSLITSLSSISSHSKPGGELSFPSQSLSVPGSPTPRSPRGGSFGVDYGAFSQPSLGGLQEEDTPIDELAASPPVIRTAKPPSGFSPLTAPKSPREDGLKSFLGRGGRGSNANLSRPSSKGSATSHDPETQSIGNLSIERGTTPSSPPKEKGLRKQKSYDSWGRKTGRNQKGLMYMSSKERLREKELEKKRASGGAATGHPGALGSVVGVGVAYTSGTVSPRPEQFLAETTINEEPSIPSLSGEETKGQEQPGRNSDVSGNTVSTPRPIPTRDSSLRKTGTSAKRSSKRNSKRDSDGTVANAILEIDESSPGSLRNQRHDPRGRRTQARQEQEGGDDEKRSADLARSGGPERSRTMPSNTKRPQDLYFGPTPQLDFDLDDGAPSPAVSQGRRRDELSQDRSRRRSGRHTPEPLEGVRLKRSSSKLKRLSGAQSPLFNEAASAHDGHGAGDHPHVGYERPRSADSIDDAVESYLCSPRLSQKIRHPQTGRVISFSEVGDPSGSAVFCCVGMGLTRYITAFYDELALTLKLRLITPDRPGVGDSEPHGDGTATPLGWPDDVYAICQSLKITKFSILAHSAGAIYALATALRMPQHIRGRIHLLAPWIPPSQMSVFGASAQTPLPPTNAIPTSQRILRALPTPILKAANSSFMSATSSSITSSLPKQKRSRRDRKSGGAGAGSNKANGGGSLDNKENTHEEEVKRSTISDMPTAPARDLMENMDRIRPDGTVSAHHHGSASNANGNTSNGNGDDNGNNVHGRHGSNSSANGRRNGAGAGGGSGNNGARSSSNQRAIHKDEILSAAAALESERERQAVYDSRLTHAIWELATTGANPAVDLLVCLERRHTIGFRYVDITRPVVIHHGSRDTRVPVENVKWLGKTMRRCEVRVLEGEGHGLMASATVMGGVLMEVSREWEEWGRVTGQTRRERETRR